MGVVYCVTNVANGKKYIGKTIGLFEDRRKVHIESAMSGSEACSAFYRAIRKHGVDLFYWEILFESELSNALILMERIEIHEQNTLAPLGYNLIVGGTPDFGGRSAEEVRMKVSKALKGKPKTKEHCENVSKALTGKKLSETHVLALKNAVRPKQTPESNEKRRLTQLQTPKICGVCGECGHNKRTCPQLTEEQRAMLPKRKAGSIVGKTYDEIYGSRADHYRSLRSLPRLSSRKT